VTEVVCDASVALKWVLTEGEGEVASARSLIAGHHAGRLTALILDLTLYEIANVLIRGRRRSAEEAVTVVDALAEICPVIVPTSEARHLAATLASERGLTFYDAAYAAVAQDRGALLATADRQLVEAGLGDTPTEVAARLKLPST
jgi:predicted nucleic acid-binding protein